MTAEDFMRAKQVQEISITEETRQAIRAGIESETYYSGQSNMYCFLFCFL